MIEYQDSSSFDKRNSIKKDIEQNKKRIFVNCGDVCYVILGKNIWYEQNWKNDNFGRPVLVI